MDSGGAANSSLPEFRRALIGWLDEHLTPELVGAARGGLDDPDQLEMLRAWNRVLADARWAVPAWPAEHGGRDATVDEQLAYLEVMAEKGAPGPVNVIGVANIAPAILEFGTQLQKDRFIAPLLRGDEIWCQGMSEPDAGSDLASLRTTARLVGDEFVVDGQKTWNSLGHLADWCQLYVRTDPEAPKHAGISCLLVDMLTPGIEVSPVRTMAGDRTFSELFFSEARIPSSALLGPLNDGWRVAMTTLSYERAGVAKFHLALTDRFNELLETTRKTGATVTPYYRDRLAGLRQDRLSPLDDGPRAGSGRARQPAEARHGFDGEAPLVGDQPGGRRPGRRCPRPGGARAPLVDHPARFRLVVDRGRYQRDQPQHRGRARPRAATVRWQAGNLVHAGAMLADAGTTPPLRRTS